MFWKIVGALIVAWLAITVFGVVIKGLFWLAVIGGVLFVGTSVYSAIKGKDEAKRLKQ